MLVALVFFVLSIFIYFIIIKYRQKRISNGLYELPRLRGWPIVGNFFVIHEPLWSYLFKASKKYGPIFKITLGCREIVVLNSYKILKKTLKELGNNFSGRYQDIVVKTCLHDSGIIFKDEQWWSIQRNFVIKILKDFGMGKQRSTDIVNQECSILLKEIEEKCGKVTRLSDLFTKSTVNVISILLMNMRFERDHEKFILLTDIVEKLVHKNNVLEQLITMYPILEQYMGLSKLLLWLTGINKEYDTAHSFIKEIIDEHKAKFNFENEGEDLMDIFLKEQYKLNQNNIQNHTFTDWQLIRVGIELFAAGFDTTSSTLVWSMLLLAKHSDIQDKVHQEIINFIGTIRIPNLEDKKSLQYTQAVMDEIFRFSSVVPLAIPHRVLENTKVEEYFISKNSVVFPNIYACHRDSDVWEKPFEFYPEHFLTLDKGKIKYSPRDELVSFSVGKRQCLGEALARLEYFVFLASILQRFKVKLEEGMTDEAFSKIVQGTDGIIRAPLDSYIIFEII